MSLQLIIVDHNFSQVQPVPRELRELLSYEEKQYNRRTKHWKIQTHEIIDGAGTFYTGLVPLVQEKFPDASVLDNRQWPSYFLHTPTLSVKLREYQIDYLIDALSRKRLIVDAATGSGKTVIIAAILATLNLPSLILVPNKTILAQHLEELAKLIPDSRFGVASGEKVEDARWMIGLPSTLVKFPAARLREFQVLIADEAHTVAASRASDVILTMNAPFRFGFTGSATGRSDNRDLVVQGLLGPVVKLIEPQELTRQGYLAPVIVEMHRGAWDGDYAALEELLIVKNQRRNELIVKIVKQHRGPILILVRRIEHGEILQKMIPNSTFVHGDSPADFRESVRQAVKSGALKVLIASNIFAMGLDIPNLELGINAAGGKAEILTGQRFGRITRPWNEMVKKWIDIYDNYQGTLEEHSKERLEVYKQKTQLVQYVGFPPGQQRRLESGEV